MKKLISLFLSLALVCCFGVTVLAAGDDTQPDATITENTGAAPEDAVVVDVPEDTGQQQKPPATVNPLAVTLQPIQVRMEMVGDVPYITKTYEGPQDETINAWMYQVANLPSFEQDGYAFSRYDSYSQIQPTGTESRTETETATLSIEKEDKALVLAAADPTIQYDEGGFIGQLKLVEESIVITEAGRENYSYRVTDVREYKNLDRQDAAYIPKTVTKNGVELQLENVEWTVMGTSPTADGPVANLFKATATYGGGASGSRASGYTATYRYEGTVSREIAGATYVNVVFRGEKIVAPEPIVESSTPVLPVLATILCVLAVLAIAVVAFVTRGKWSKVLVREKAGNTKDINIDGIRQAAEYGYDDSLYDAASGTDPVSYSDEHQNLFYQEDQENGEDGQDDGAADYAGEGYYYGQYPDDDE